MVLLASSRTGRPEKLARREELFYTGLMASPPRRPPSDEATLANQAMVERIGRAVTGDKRAIRELVDTLTPIIQKHVMRVLLRRRRASGNRDVRQEVADLAQSVFLALFADGGRELRQWDPARGSALPTFIGLLTEREVASIFRSRRRSPWTEDPTPDEEIEPSDRTGGLELEIASKEMLAAIAARLREQLNDRGLELFYMLLVDERSTEDVCTITGMTADAVYAWRSRLMKLIRKIAAEISSGNEAERRIQGED